MKLTPSATGPAAGRRKLTRNADGGSSAPASGGRGTVVRLSRIGVVPVIRRPAVLRCEAESARAQTVHRSDCVQFLHTRQESPLFV